MVEKLLNEVFENITIGSSLEYSGEEDAILRVRRKNVIPTIPVESGDLHRCYTERRPASTSEADPFITS